MNAANVITGTDVLIYLNMAGMLIGFVSLYVKLVEKISKNHETTTNRLTRLETDSVHMMRKLGMEPRKIADGELYGASNND